MPRTLLCWAALAAFPLLARADQTVTATETVIRLTVQPRAAPKPALRYLLLPELKEINPGNPITGYLNCFRERSSSGRERFGAAALRQADRAARLDKPDWQILLRAKTDGIGLLLPDLQELRELAAGLEERFRAEIALHHFEHALRTAKTMFAMARHMGEHPTLIGDLVGIAIAAIALRPLEEMLEQPGCPNLYWALTNLPSPLISLDKGMEGERLLILAELRDLDDSTPMSEEQLKKLIAHIDKLLTLAGNPKRDGGGRAWLNARIKNEGSVRAARQRLVEVGLSEERLRQFPADQVILLDEKREYEVQRDEVMKLTNLPAWQVEALTARIKPDKEPRPASTLFGFLVPALQKVRRAQARLEQRIALLRHVEALRMFAAEHDGKLPAKLTDCPVPLPPDPFTGKAFHYKLDGATAHLRGSPPPGEEKNPVYNLHFEVTIRK